MNGQKLMKLTLTEFNKIRMDLLAIQQCYSDSFMSIMEEYILYYSHYGLSLLTPVLR